MPIESKQSKSLDSANMSGYTDALATYAMKHHLKSYWKLDLFLFFLNTYVRPIVSTTECGVDKKFGHILQSIILARVFYGVCPLILPEVHAIQNIGV